MLTASVVKVMVKALGNGRKMAIPIGCKRVTKVVLEALRMGIEHPLVVVRPMVNLAARLDLVDAFNRLG